MVKRIISVFMILVLLISFEPQILFASTEPEVVKVYTDKSRYNPSSTATITVELDNQDTSSWSGNVYLEVNYLETTVYTTSASETIAAESTDTVTFNWTVPSTDFKGYLVKAYISSNNYETTAIDCSSDMAKYPRYGYISDFPSGQTTTESDSMVEELSRDYHINAFQFYDWMWRHDEMIKRTNGVVDSTWTDLFGRTIDSGTIEDMIDAVQGENAKAMAYVMSYAAREGYDSYGVDASSGLYSDRNHSSQLNVDFGNQSTYLWLFNPSDESWQDYIISQYDDAMDTLGFDGLQIDQMGERNNLYDYFGRHVYLGDSFSDLVNAAKTEVGTNKEVTFNVVDGTTGGWALKDVSMNANTDFSFSEIWWKSDSYSDIKDYIEEFRTNTNGQALVLAAYMNYEDNTGTRYEAESASLNNVSTNTNHSGYTGTGFVDGFAEQGDYVEFSVNAPEDGLYPLVFRYSNNIDAEATRNVYVDGSKIGSVTFKDLTSWDDWSHLDSFIATNLTSGSHTIKVSYDSDNSGAINLDSLTFGEFDEDSIRLADAAFAASGAYHIEIGTNENHATMLPHEYYASLSKTMRSDLREAMMEHYDFITAYENLLFDPDINYGDSGTQFVEINGESVSGSGESGKIWTMLRQKDEYDIVHLINLTGESDSEWRNETSAPTTKTNLAIKYYLGPDKTVSGVYYASPDIYDGVTKSLSYTSGSDSKGTYISFTVDSLEYWDMIYVKYTDNMPEDGVYEAEEAVKVSVSTNTNHSGYSGTGFVDSFASENDSVSFAISVEEEKDYTLSFNYANATGSQATRAIFVDGEFVGKIYMDSLADWDTWDTAEIGLNLSVGPHQVVVIFGEYETTAVNLDYMQVSEKVESARSLYLNNWSNLVFLWKDSYLNSETSVLGDGPGLYELRFYEGNSTDDYDQNQIDNYSTFIRNETDSTKYMNGEKFRSTGYFGTDGILYNEYQTYDGDYLKPEITKAYAAVPDENFIVTKYTIKNTYSSQKTFRILDMLKVNNEGTGNISASYNTTDNYATIDMTNSNQYVIAHGTLESSIDGYQVADDSDTTTTSNTCSPWITFDNDGTLKNNGSVSASDISTAFVKEVTLAAGAETSFYFYVAIGEDTTELSSAVSAVEAQSGSYWMSHIASDYSSWLAEGKSTSFSDTKLNDAYDAISITIKQSTVPGSYTDGTDTIHKFAAMPAATNPSAYSYKVWARDSAVSAMALDASGHLDEAENYWYWLADRQIKTDQGSWKKPGTFWTCYWIWDNSSVSFVEPEYDSIGMFLVGAYRHYEALPTAQEKADFLDGIWTSYRLSAEFVRTNIDSNGFGIADCSIWEETTEFNGFTQALYIAGMDAAQMMATAKGETSDADNYNGAAATMRSAVQRDSTATTRGLWDVSEARYNRAVTTSGAENTLHDSSSDVLISYGVIDAESSRAKSHIDSIMTYLQHDEYGIARYDDDGFYHDKPWDPGGDEALESEPSWPQMSMWVAMYEIQSGIDSYKANAYRRLNWFVDRTAKGYMPQGEAVSNVTKKPAISTMVEPITGAAYIMTALAYENQFDMRVLPPQYNVGAYKEITVSSGTDDDWDQWYNVPYFKDAQGDDSVSDTDYDIDRVYIANDSSNLYIRIDNVSRALPGYNASEKFAVYVYSEDYDTTASTKDTSNLGNGLSRDMSYAFARYSNSSNFFKMDVDNGNWTWESNLTSVIAPQWETTSGRIELVIPFSELASSGSVSDNEWANIDIVLVKQTNPSTDTWEDADSISIHYRKTGSSYEWLYGNVD